jgi:protein TonB
MKRTLRSRFQLDPVQWKVGMSVAVHLVVIAMFVQTRKVWVAPLLMPGDADGSRRVLTYLPGRSAVSAATPVKVKVVKRAPATALDKAALPVRKQEEVVAASTNAPVSAKPDGTTGDDALGSGNVSIALVKSFPTPKPDLSKLPRGTAGDVVVDIVIDETGKVASLTTMKGLGYGVDEEVLATVKGWVFQPATKDGKPVASEQELLFHYEARG